MKTLLSNLSKKIIEFGYKALAMTNNNLFLCGTLLTGSVLNFLIILFIAITGFGFPPESARTLNNFNYELVSDLLAASSLIGLIATSILSWYLDRKDTSKNRSFINIFANCFVIGLFGISINSILIFVSLYLGVSGDIDSMFEIVSMEFFVIIPFAILGLVLTFLISLALSFLFKTIELSSKLQHSLI